MQTSVQETKKAQYIKTNVVKLSPNVAKKVTGPSQRHIHTYEYFLLHVFWTCIVFEFVGSARPGRDYTPSITLSIHRSRDMVMTSQVAESRLSVYTVPVCSLHLTCFLFQCSCQV